MKLPVESSAELAENQKRALISLLADENVTVYQAVKDKLLSLGPIAADWVKRYSLSDDPLLRRRAREIIEYFGRQRADRDFLSFCLSQGEHFDLEQASLLLAQTQYPETNPEGYSAVLDNFAGDVRERVDLSGAPEAILKAINDYLFTEQGFEGNEQGYYDPQNTYLNRVIDRRKGNPISLCLVYLLIARRLQLPLVGIGLPGHFLCRLQTPRDELYVDAFNHGKLLSKSDCIRYVLQIRHRLDEGYLSPLTPRRMLLRTCANLHQIYTQTRQPAEMQRLQHYVVALAQNS